MTGDTTTDQQRYWDDRYAETDQMWSGQPNVVLVAELGDLTPGRALDLGCGEGADAIWLAERGWQVTAVDISRVALDRAAEHARHAGVDGRIDWQHHDLSDWAPAGEFDLVSAQFLHSEGELPREAILRTAAEAVVVGGVLLVVGHAGHAPWEHTEHPHIQLPSPQEVLEALDPSGDHWDVLRSDEHDRVQAGPDGVEMTRRDSTLKLRRRPA